jgi:hypothetical protein
MASQTLYSSHAQQQQQQLQQQQASGNGHTTRHKPPALAINGHGNESASAAAHECPPRAYSPLFPDSDEGVSSEDEADSPGGDLAVLSPSSVTSPPYWSSHTHNHGGVPPNMSSESVAPGAIMLQDNEFDDGPGGANVYGRDRNRACWAKSVQVRDYVLVNGSTTNIGAFAVWNIRVETLNVGFWNLDVACV